MSANPATFPTARRSALLPSAPSAALLSSLSLYESDGALIERIYGTKPDTQIRLGYRSLPELFYERVPYLKGRKLSQDEYASMKRRATAFLDAMLDDEFFDWLVYEKTSIEELEREALKKVEYKTESLPLYQIIIESELNAMFAGYEVQSPGYYFDGGLRLKLPKSGVIAPARRGGQIRALYHYPKPDQPQAFLITSNGLPQGTKATPSIHIINSEYARDTGVLVLTDTIFNCDALGVGGMVTVAARNGLSPFALLLQLRESFAGLRSILLDTIEPDYMLIRKLRESGLKVEVAD